MKCLYYLTSTLDSTRKISDDLHQAGVNDWFIHVMSKDESGLKKEKIHSSIPATTWSNWIFCDMASSAQSPAWRLD